MKIPSRRTETAAATVWILLVAGGSLLALAWILFGRMPTKTAGAGPAPATATSGGIIQLTAASQAVLAGLGQPVEVRYYQLLRQRPGREVQLAFAERVEAMLRAFDAAAAGKIQWVSHTNPDSESERIAAGTEGLEALAGPAEAPEFLGIAVGATGNKVVLARLDPQWEPALEFDLARAIARVAGQSGVSLATANPAPVAAAELAALKAAVPEFESLSRSEARQQLQAKALAEFRQRVAALQGEAQPNSAAPQLTASQTEELNEITRRLQRQLELVDRLKP